MKSFTLLSAKHGGWIVSTWNDEDGEEPLAVFRTTAELMAGLLPLIDEKAARPATVTKLAPRAVHPPD